MIVNKWDKIVTYLLDHKCVRDLYYNFPTSVMYLELEHISVRSKRGFLKLKWSLNESNISVERFSTNEWIFISEYEEEIFWDRLEASYEIKIST